MSYRGFFPAEKYMQQPVFVGPRISSHMFPSSTTNDNNNNGKNRYWMYRSSRSMWHQLQLLAPHHFLLYLYVESYNTCAGRVLALGAVNSASAIVAIVFFFFFFSLYQQFAFAIQRTIAPFKLTRSKTFLTFLRLCRMKLPYSVFEHQSTLPPLANGKLMRFT